MGQAKEVSAHLPKKQIVPERSTPTEVYAFTTKFFKLVSSTEVKSWY
jgi:hypothetical protein